MSIFHLFEQARRANADWYTRNPVDSMSDEELAALIERFHLETSVEELRIQAITPHVEMTCALCGCPQAHLVSCSGCGRDAWGWEWEMEYGGATFESAASSENAAAQLRAHTAPELKKAGISDEQVQHGLKHAWQWGGCMICTECWQHTLPVETYQICPLYLISEGVLASNQVPAFLWPLVFGFAENDSHQTDDVERKRQIFAELNRVATHWLDTWNTAPDSERDQVARWRAGLLRAYMPETVQTEPTSLQGEEHE